MTEEEIKLQLYKSLIDEKKEKSGLIPVTYLIYDCPRRGYYSETIGQFHNLKTLFQFWIGRAIHEKSILQGENEIELRTANIIGRIDEYKDGTLLEKKTTKRITDFLPNHYVKQIEYYTWLLEMHRKSVKDCWLLFIQLNPPNSKFVQIHPRNLEVLDKEIQNKAQKIKDGLDLNFKPERKIGWLCNYCEFASVCFKEEKDEK